MNGMLLIGMIGGGALLVALIIFGLLISRSRKTDLDSVPEGETPSWIHSNIPDETMNASLADKEGITLFDQDPGEDLAAPFAEQIEDILQAQLQADPELTFFDVDFGTAPDGGIEFHFRGETYLEIDQIPEEPLRDAIKKAIEKYNQMD
ncbi:MAG: hypothetical protein MUO54_05360 [Anaerolineales bacterium]|nr:hypothetical protein [Anaerolineales bacterium]